MEPCYLNSPLAISIAVLFAALISFFYIRLLIQRTNLTAQLQCIKDELARLTEARHALHEELENHFQRVSSQALDRNSEHFLRLTKESLQTIQAVSQERVTNSCGAVSKEIKSLAESLAAVSERRARIDGELAKQIDHLSQSAFEVSTETSRLRKALTTTRGQGIWGEQQLKSLLKHSGMIEHADFLEQSSIVEENKINKIRPDVIVRLPNGFHIAIDAKAPLNSFLDLHAVNEEERGPRLAEFRNTIKRHVRELSSKRYSEQITESGLSHTILFLPADSLLHSLSESGDDLISYARDFKIMIATPSTLLALLCSAATLWREQTLVDNAREIETLGKQLYERLSKFADSFSEVGSLLERTVRSYNAATGTLESRLMVSARKFAAYGIGNPDNCRAREVIEEVVRIPG